MADVVSRGFTGRSEWMNPAGTRLCRVCAWAYRDERVRRHPMVICRRPGEARLVDGAGARAELRRALPEDMALTVPRTGRKHLLPSAMWGRIFFDDVAIPWNTADAHRLRAVEHLRAAGASEADLRRPSPPWPLLRSAGGAHMQVLSTWPLLDP